MSRRSPLLVWALIALVLRGISATTHSTWLHPDEWYQTVEFANFISRGFISNVQEVSLHMRNLTWPFLLSLPLRLAEWLSPGWVWGRVVGVQLFTSFIDLGMLWGVWQLLQSARKRPELKLLNNPRVQHWALAFFVMPWFLILEGIRPSLEHLSVVAFWVALGFYARRSWLLAGFFSVAVFAARYPSALLSAGLGIALVASAWRERAVESPFRRLGLFALGALAGIALFGACDAVYYGRPWESFWMYLQYNVFTGHASAKFGEQSPLVYWGYLVRHFRGLYLPLALVVLTGAVWDFPRGLKRMDPMAWAIGLYVLGHCLIGHKEPRFIGPVETLLLWYGFAGALAWSRSDGYAQTIGPWISRLRNQSWFGQVSRAWFYACGIVVLRTLYGELFSAPATFFELPALLAREPDTCAFISMRRPLASYQFSSLPFGVFDGMGKNPSYSDAAESPLWWVEREPDCKPGQTILLHVGKPDEGWSKYGCELIESSLLRFVPGGRDGTMGRALIENDLLRGPWYRCSPQVRTAFRIQERRRIYARTLGTIERLPPYGITGAELLRIRWSSPNGPLDDATFVVEPRPGEPGYETANGK